MGIKLTNNANATLAASINSSATSITLTSGQGARFPTLSAGDYFYATLIDTSNNLEIVKCTARSTDVLTVVRAQESTTARAYNTGDRIEIRLTAQTFLDATSVYDILTASTGYFDLPTGTTAQRPGSPVDGMIRYNTTLSKVEAYENGAWRQFDITYEIEYLVVAGGGGGGGGDGGQGMGGGGAGGFLTNVGGAGSTITPGTAFTVTVGAGGAGGIYVASPGTSTNGVQGSNSSFGTVVSAVGGGYGNGTLTTGGNGGSGGGGSGSASTVGGAGGSGTAGQGNAGGTGGNSSSSAQYYGGAGGGASTAGQSAAARGTSTTGCTGGAGTASSITGSSVTYAGGGGGGVIAAGFSPGMTGGAAGAGGGGKGGDSLTSGTQTNGTAGTANTGGGGGGSGYQRDGGAGGSGIVIVRYVGAQKGTGGTVTSSGGYTIHTFTSSGTYTA